MFILLRELDDVIDGWIFLKREMTREEVVNSGYSYSNRHVTYNKEPRDSRHKWLSCQEIL